MGVCEGRGWGWGPCSGSFCEDSPSSRVQVLLSESGNLEVLSREMLLLSAAAEWMSERRQSCECSWRCPVRGTNGARRNPS